ncbi:hypothetical protein J2S16_004121 [Cytobacillus kochii]|nr:hypothetical protein [Cytobacillus kochii]
MKNSSTKDVLAVFYIVGIDVDAEDDYRQSCE